MKNRLMRLAGLLKEDDFELPDESPFDVSFPDNHHIYLDIVYPASEYNRSTDDWVSLPPILQKIEFKKGDCRVEAYKFYHELSDDLYHELDYHDKDDIDLKDILNMEQDDVDCFAVHDDSRRSMKIYYFIGPSYAVAGELLNLYNTKGNNTSYQDVKSLLP